MRKNWWRAGAMRWIGCAVAVAALAVGIGAAVLAASTVDPAFEPVVRRLVADGFSEAKLRRLFSRAEMVFSSRAMADKLTALYMRKYGLKLVADTQARLAGLGWYPGPVDGRLDRMTKWSIKAYQTAVGLAPRPEASQALLDELARNPKPAPADLVFPEFRTEEVHDVVLSPERLAEARDFYAVNRKALARVRERYGVPEEYLVALLAVETRVGRYLGDEVAVINLSSLVAAEDPARVASAFAYEGPAPDRQAWLDRKALEKGEWAYGELKALLKYADAQNMDPLSIPGSVYGAIGICQFMPSNAVKYAVDGNGDGKADLFETEDALASLGNILRVMGWKPPMTEEAMRKVFYGYNHSQVYVNTIMGAAARLRDDAASGTIK
ncbi:Peptidoglycan-binding domain 1 protein [Solidesulfovibrio carbinoliphilus subsp. oakridgensis]|uniref:Peptidoglycan-binding domain 1 protein n=2 Tax=Solidesulfovibrio carbinoliphilus TaxID=345370 RepID=G7Q8U9_9BACT|nr:Peptidoglycan-binding domain 1 protein [Solidesulfovibrio carbinoliphilus subsp. oakridgensis]